MIKKYDRLPYGLLIGSIFPNIILLAINVLRFKNLGYFEFLQVAYDYGQLISWLKISLLVNLIPFFLAINSNRMRLGQGIIAATFIFGAVIIYLMFS